MKLSTKLYIPLTIPDFFFFDASQMWLDNQMCEKSFDFARFSRKLSVLILYDIML